MPSLREDRANQATAALNARREERARIKAAQDADTERIAERMAQQQAEREAKDAAILEGNLKRGYLRTPGATEEGWLEAKDQVLAEHRAEAAHRQVAKDRAFRRSRVASAI